MSGRDEGPVSLAQLDVHQRSQSDNTAHREAQCQKHQWLRLQPGLNLMPANHWSIIQLALAQEYCE
jgi:hypothetical protein